MPWTDLEAPNERGWRRVKCTNCGHVMKSPYPHEKIHCHCDLPDQPPAFGPGTELTNVIAEFAPAGCHSGMCPQRAAEMNTRGIAWCQENRETIIGWLKEAAKTQSWLEAAQSAGALLTKTWFDPLRPFDSILDEALRRAEKHNAK